MVPPGLNLAGHGTRTSRPGPLTIGYFARVCPDKGLHQLAAALPLLAADASVPPVQVWAAGYLDAADRPYFTEIRRQIGEAGLGDRFHYVGPLDRAAKIAFLQSLDLFCLPTVYRESKGLSVLEAWANAVPAVLPAHGAFPEMVADTGGGVLVAPNDPAALAAGLKRMLLDAPLAAECGRRAQRAVHERYNAEVMARRMMEVYEQHVSTYSSTCCAGRWHVSSRCAFPPNDTGRAPRLRSRRSIWSNRWKRRFSYFQPGSQISRINALAADGPVEVSPPLFELLRLAMTLYEETEGAYDITSTPLWEAWGFARRAGEIPVRCTTGRGPRTGGRPLGGTGSRAANHPLSPAPVCGSTWAASARGTPWMFAVSG